MAKEAKGVRKLVFELSEVKIGLERKKLTELSKRAEDAAEELARLEKEEAEVLEKLLKAEAAAEKIFLDLKARMETASKEWTDAWQQRIRAAEKSHNEIPDQKKILVKTAPTAIGSFRRRKAGISK